MKPRGPGLPTAALAAALVLATGAAAFAANPQRSATPVVAPTDAVQLAQGQDDGYGTEPARELQPAYEPAPPQQRSSYNDAYIFGLTRGVADSAMHPAAKVLLFPITVPLDLALLPFEAIGGLFG